MNWTAFLFFTVTFICLASTCTGCDNNGIVGLEGYEHGVAFCGNEFPVVGYLTSKGEASYDKENDITYVINHGHGDDPQVDKLKKLATTECAKLK